MLKFLKSNIPNTITCLSLVCGFAAIVATFNYDTVFAGIKGYEWAYLLIGFAALCDFCDGAAARLLHAYSALGKELDSLSDLVSFGVAPGMLIYNTIAHHSVSPWVAFFAVLIPVMGELRLARFNIDDRQTTSFLGMPIPANALFWIGTCAAVNKYGYPGDIVMVIAIIVMSLLMVTTPLKMFSLKFKNFNLGENIRRYEILLAAVIFLAIDGVSGLTWTILFYVLLSLVPAKSKK